MKYPTQFELATLAACYTGSGSPQERVTAALLIWKIAGETLEAAERMASQESEHATAMQEVRNIFKGRSTILLEDLLEHLLPQASHTERMESYRAFMRIHVRNSDAREGRSPRTEAELEDEVSTVIKRECVTGIPAHNFTNRVRRIREGMGI